MSRILSIIFTVCCALLAVIPIHADVAPPTITSFSPTTTYVNEPFTIYGTNLSSTSSINFGGWGSLPFTVIDDNRISTVAPDHAHSGWLSVSTLGGIATSVEEFTAVGIPVPTISSFSPSSAYDGESGQVITITGTNFNGAPTSYYSGATSVGVGNYSVPFTVVNDNTITFTWWDGYPARELWVTTAGGQAISVDNFVRKPIPAPTVTSFTPNSAYAGEFGQVITITGTNFNGAPSSYYSGASHVGYGNQSVPFTVVNDTTITFKLWIEMPTGPIYVTTAGGTAWSADDFVRKPIPVPTITSFTPNRARIGAQVTITGTNFTGTTTVNFNGTPAATYSVDSDTSVTAIVPYGATTGKITITSPGGTAMSGEDFILVPELSFPLSGTIESWGGQRIYPGDLPAFTAITAGLKCTVGLDRMGTVYIWGQCGFTSPVGFVPEPNQDFVSVKTGRGGNYGLKRDGSIVGLGYYYPVPEPNKDFTAISAGGNAVGLKRDGSIVSWGPPDWGQNSVPEPNQDFVAVSAAQYYTVGLKRDGSVIVWRDSLGLSLPAPNTDFIAIAAGQLHIVGLKRDGSVVCWGRNSENQCTVPEPNQDFIAIAAGDIHSVGLKRDGSIVTWGRYTSVPQPNRDFIAIDAVGGHTVGLKRDGSVVYLDWDDFTNMPSPYQTFTSVAANGLHVVGLKSDGSVVCSGDNTYGACRVPEPNSGFSAVAVGTYHSVGLKIDGSVVCWGYGDLGQKNVPTPNQDFTAIAAGTYHTIGLKRDGSIVTWGYNSNGQFDVPAPNQDFVDIAGASMYTAGLKADGSIRCWGDNTYGQCNVPAPNKDFVKVVLGDAHAVGLKQDGSVVCWGWNKDGQCDVPSPNRDFVSIKAGATHTVGLKRDGSIVIWGYSPSGTSVPSPNSGIIGIGAGDLATTVIRSIQTHTGQVQLGSFTGDIQTQPISAVISSVFDPSISQYLKLLPQSNGNFTLNSYLLPPYDIRFTSPHFLTVKVANPAPQQSLGVVLTNGDADGGNSINLFDFVVLDSKFGSSNAMADLNGDGAVNLFDYVIIDQNFGAMGD